MEQRELSLTADGDTKWCSHFGRPFGPFVQNYTQTYHTTQQSYCQASPSRSENLCWHKNVHANVSCSKARTQCQYVSVWLTQYCANQERPVLDLWLPVWGPHFPPTRRVTWGFLRYTLPCCWGAQGSLDVPSWSPNITLTWLHTRGCQISQTKI